MATDYSQFLTVLANGSIWWRLEDAVKLGAGYLPVRDDEHNLEAVLRANGNLVVVNAKTLLGGFSSAHYGDHHPRYLVRDGERYVEAHEFLDWLCRLAHDQAFPFPCALACAVKGAGRRTASSPNFESLTAVLDAWFDKPLAGLPQNLRQRVEQDFSPMDWNVLSQDQRRSVALQWDGQNDPATEGERQYWWDFFIRMDGVKGKITHWQSAATPTAEGLAKKEMRLAELELSLARMEHQLRLPQGYAVLEPQLFNDAETESRILAEVEKSGHGDCVIEPGVQLQGTLQNDTTMKYQGDAGLGPQPSHDVETGSCVLADVAKSGHGDCVIELGMQLQGAFQSDTSMKIGSPEWRKENARIAANAKHDKPGGSRDKKKQIRELWATGKYKSREICAEQECAAIGMSFASARKALRNIQKENNQQQVRRG